MAARGFHNFRERGTPTNLLKTPPVGTKPTPDGARLNGTRCGQAKTETEIVRAAPRPPYSQRGEATIAAPPRKHAHTDAVPHGKPAPGALPHGKKNATAPHEAVAATQPPPLHLTAR